LIVIGIDPGTARTGYGVIKKNKKSQTYEVLDYGCITTSKELSLPDRLVKIAEDLEKLILKYKPNQMAVESLFFAANAKTASDVGQARGVIILTGRQKGISIFEYTPLEVKLALTGYGRAEKKQMQSMVKALLLLEKVPTPDDAADALAIAICHGNSFNGRNLAKRDL